MPPEEGATAEHGQQRPSVDRTMLVKSPQFRADGKAWRPYKFGGMEKVSRTQVMLTDRVGWLMPGVDGEGKVSEPLLARLRELLDEDVQLKVDSVRAVPPAELKDYLHDPILLASLVAAPHKARAFLEIELGLAHAAIDRLLGGAGEAMAVRTLTEIEEGVLSFVILETLKALAPRIEPGLPRIRLEGMVAKAEEARQALASERHVVVVQLKGVLGTHAGSLRFFLPETVMALVNPAAGGPERRARVARSAKANMHRLRRTRTTLRAVMGTLILETSQLKALRQRDVVVLDELRFRSDQGATGPVELFLGRGRVGHVRAEASVVDGRYRATLQEFVFGESPRLMTPSAPEASIPALRGNDLDEKNEGSELLADVPLQISVELARVDVSAEDVVSLRVGQVVDLSRLPNEPVDLSVNGTVVARGELVEVEGHMGVRILSLAG